MEEKQATPDAVPQWQLDLDKVGFVRRLFLARKWYGGDWWFVAVSAVLLLFIILLGVAPQWFAPHDPREEVGPALLAPGEVPLGYVLVVPAGSSTCRWICSPPTRATTSPTMLVVATMLRPAGTDVPPEVLCALQAGRSINNNAKMTIFIFFNWFFLVVPKKL